jgi:hypothetical protein
LTSLSSRWAASESRFKASLPFKTTVVIIVLFKSALIEP